MFIDQRSTLAMMAKSAPVTFFNVALVTVMFVITLATGGFTGQNLFRLGALFTPAVIDGNEWWRLVTVMYLHGSFMHFFFNTMFGLVIISASLERLIGPLKFALVYFFSGVGASLVTVGSEFISGSPTLGVGASGAIYGVLGAYLLLTYKNPDWFSPQDIQSIRGLILINVIFTFIVPNISITAHLGGLGVGVLLTLLLAPKPFARNTRRGFQNPYEDTYDPFDPKNYQHLEDIEIVEDDEDEDDPWGRYS